MIRIFPLSVATSSCLLGVDTHCKTCISNTTCLTCDTGYFGSTCSEKCSPGCLRAQCLQENGQCTFGPCENGYYGAFCCPIGHIYSNCSIPCPSHCAKCYSTSNCFKCMPGYYGKTCSNKCSPGCRLAACNFLNGHCVHQCITDHHGPFCCPRGLHGINCSMECPSNCSLCTSDFDCAECKSGYFGSTCQYQCPNGCKTNKCDQRRGVCSGCLDNHVGEYCCPYGIYGSNCSLTCPINCKKCYSDSFCDVCYDGFFGNLCSDRCPENCKTCTSDRRCSTCNTGYYGTTCLNQCSRGCMNNICQQNDGRCRCKTGFYGELCCPFDYVSVNCSLKCQPHCKQCSSPSVCSACHPGYYGPTCSERCPNGCKGSVCDKETGKCTLGCHKDRYGPYCTTCHTDVVSCTNERCKTCTSDMTCLECYEGFFGKDCMAKCSPGCVGGVCVMSNGTCILGCTSNQFSGENCCSVDQNINICHEEMTCSPNCQRCLNQTDSCLECYPGFYTNTCYERCPVRCLNARCSISGGFCTGGCQEGFGGEQCELIGKYF